MRGLLPDRSACRELLLTILSWPFSGTPAADALCAEAARSPLLLLQYENKSYSSTSKQHVPILHLEERLSAAQYIHSSQCVHL